MAEGTEMNVELLPCPFCGDAMKLETIDDVVTGPGQVFVQCDCGATSAGGGDLDEAIAAWNRRAARPADVGAGELPPLPKPDVIAYSCVGHNDAYSPMLVERIRRDAIAADREHQKARIMHLTHERDKAREELRAQLARHSHGEELAAVAAFLDGSAPLEGVWFGQPHPSGKPWWWRKNLREAMAGAAPPLSSEQQAAPRNQCDGCCQGAPLNEWGNHVDGNGKPFMGCEKRRYESASEQQAEKG